MLTVLTDNIIDQNHLQTHHYVTLETIFLGAIKTLQHEIIFIVLLFIIVIVILKQWLMLR